MPIKGLTDSTRMPANIKVSMGYVKSSGDKTMPAKGDRFYISSRSRNSNGWKINPKLYDKLLADQQKRSRSKTKTDRLIDILIAFPSNDVDDIWRANYERWTKSKLHCRGNNETAIHYLDDGKEEEIKCNEDCPYRKDGKCKPYAVLYFSFAILPSMLTVAKFVTTGQNTIANISSGLKKLKEVTGGKIFGVPLNLIMFLDRNRKHGGWKPIASLQMRSDTYDDIITLVEQSSERHKRLENVKIEDPEVPHEIVEEFFPESEVISHSEEVETESDAEEDPKKGKQKAKENADTLFDVGHETEGNMSKGEE